MTDPENSLIPSDRAEAYRLALYRVEALEGSFVLKVDEPSQDVKGLMDLHEAKGAGYLTAYNPEGIVVSKKENLRRQQELEADLKAWVCYPGAGEDPKGKWDPEPSFLVLGIPREKALELGVKYRQNAILWMDEDGVPRLMLLR